LSNILVQVKTGEGKSIVLGVSSIIFALAGCEVYCACYSRYLSERDKKIFEKLFKAFNVEKRIHYGTFNQLCEKIINE
jgi:preprotein translocase subunit SecA